MKKINTSPLSGTQELLPLAQTTFNKLKDNLAEVYHRHGFLNIETPIIDRNEILLAKAGGDTEKQIYKVIKTTETSADADQALRFDHTVPLARYVVEHENDLSFPFAVSQIGRNFRGERAQKGRFREFYQCDVDIIGREKLSVYYDAEVIMTLLDAFETFELDTPILARINNRKILSGLIESLGLEKQEPEIFSIIDHSEKVSVEETKIAFEDLDLSDGNVAKFMAFIKLHGQKDFVIKNLCNLGIKNETFEEGVVELEQVLYTLEKSGFKDKIEADMRIVRGLDYYTGTVFEFILPEHRKIGSVCGGGRYENLVSNFSDQKFPGVGGSIGLTRLFYVLNENKLLKIQNDKTLDYTIIPVTENEIDFTLNLAQDLRKKGSSVIVVLTNKKLSDKLTYSAKIAKSCIVIGEDEVKTGKYEIKKFDQK